MGNEQANSMLGDDLSADNVFQASGDDNASEHADNVFGEEPNVADIDDAGPQISHISYVDGLTASFCFNVRQGGDSA